jgi:3-demethoxyubiquinol 3-hydroxylase
MPTFDSLINHFDNALRTLFAAHHSGRATPGNELSEAPLSQPEKATVGRLMRVNQAGEVCAQALYQGQALTARNPEVAASLRQAAREEVDHLAWCAERLEQLGSRSSLLNPLWYAGSFALGTLSGLAGDKWNLAFLAETERQVEAHLEGHLQRVPSQDQKTRSVLEQMKTDEAKHATTALAHGAAELPLPIKGAMRLASKAMTALAYWV